jgi:hypothetical protein
MRPHILSSVLAVLLLLTGASSASAQQVDIGATMADFYVAYGNGNFVGGGPIVTVHFHEKHAVQAAIDLRYRRWESSRSLTGIYSVQYRHTFQDAASATRFFLTAGAVGGVSWSRVSGYSYIETGHYEGDRWVSSGPTGVGWETRSRISMTPPWVPMFGAGIEHSITKRVALRADAATAVAAYGAVGARFSAGAVVNFRRFAPWVRSSQRAR